MNYRYRGFYIKIGFHLQRRMCVDGREEECIQVRGRQCNYGCVCLARWETDLLQENESCPPFSFHCLCRFFSTSTLQRANPDPCYLNCSTVGRKAALSLLKSLPHLQSSFYSLLLMEVAGQLEDGARSFQGRNDTSWVLNKARRLLIHLESGKSGLFH